MNTTSDPLLSVLTREGVLIKVSVRYWRGCKKLQAEDLGLHSEDVSDRLISLGHKRLLPREATASLALIEGRAHSLVEGNTFPFLNGLAHFLPNGRLADVTERLSALETEFWQAKATFLEQYERLRESAATEWQAMARKLAVDSDRLLSAIEASFPPAARMDRFYGFHVQLFQIAVPERLGVDLITLAEQREVIQARQKAVETASAHIRQETESFVADCVAALRQQTAQLCEEMLASITASDTGVHQKTLNRLIRFIDQFKGMNFANDTEMAKQLEQVRAELLTQSAEDYRQNPAASQSLQAGLARLRDHAQTLARQDTTVLVQRFGELGKRKFHLAA